MKPKDVKKSAAKEYGGSSKLPVTKISALVSSSLSVEFETTQSLNERQRICKVVREFFQSMDPPEFRPAVDIGNKTMFIVVSRKADGGNNLKIDFSPLIDALGLEMVIKTETKKKRKKAATAFRPRRASIRGTLPAFH